MLPVTPKTKRKMLGGAVMRLRQAYKIKQDTLAQGVGIHPAYLSNLERNKKDASLDVIIKIAAFLGVDVDDISYLATVYELSESAA